MLYEVITTIKSRDVARRVAEQALKLRRYVRFQTRHLRLRAYKTEKRRTFGRAGIMELCQGPAVADAETAQPRLPPKRALERDNALGGMPHPSYNFV